ncbi:hypothetical protein RFI_04922 [Reticulomyxa filosa]|uniref:Uncharacterized protein n=1 Tax=Reticulomyxa filosa TaxID=46433 RepID=X6P1T4_RETFI|nr:hypothetical protein RFI_04922 [Reticulomyxa filosa]|eukprot:ETO32196.1 hypothetical protein RFI_04922 [Reticulomyxa filosa]
MSSESTLKVEPSLSRPLQPVQPLKLNGEKKETLSQANEHSIVETEKKETKTKENSSPTMPSLSSKPSKPALESLSWTKRASGRYNNFEEALAKFAEKNEQVSSEIVESIAQQQSNSATINSNTNNGDSSYTEPNTPESTHSVHVKKRSEDYKTRERAISQLKEELEMNANEANEETARREHTSAKESMDWRRFTNASVTSLLRTGYGDGDFEVSEKILEEKEKEDEEEEKQSNRLEWYIFIQEQRNKMKASVPHWDVIEHDIPVANINMEYFVPINANTPSNGTRPLLIVHTNCNASDANQLEKECLDLTQQLQLKDKALDQSKLQCQQLQSDSEQKQKQLDQLLVAQTHVLSLQQHNEALQRELTQVKHELQQWKDKYDSYQIQNKRLENEDAFRTNSNESSLQPMNKGNESSRDTKINSNINFNVTTENEIHGFKANENANAINANTNVNGNSNVNTNANTNINTNTNTNTNANMNDSDTDDDIALHMDLDVDANDGSRDIVQISRMDSLGANEMKKGPLENSGKYASYKIAPKNRVSPNGPLPTKADTPNQTNANGSLTRFYRSNKDVHIVEADIKSPSLKEQKITPTTVVALDSQNEEAKKESDMSKKGIETPNLTRQITLKGSMDLANNNVVTDVNVSKSPRSSKNHGYCKTQIAFVFESIHHWHNALDTNQFTFGRSDIQKAQILCHLGCVTHFHHRAKETRLSYQYQK